MEWSAFLSLIRDSNSIDTKYFSSDISEDMLGPILVAMANTRGGNIIIGFDKRNYHLLGSAVDAVFVTSLIDNFCYPKPDFSLDICEKNDKKIIVISVKASPLKPYYFNNKCYVLNSERSSLSVLEKDVLQDDRTKLDRSVTPSFGDEMAFSDADITQSEGADQVDMNVSLLDDGGHSKEQLQDISDITSELLALHDNTMDTNMDRRDDDVQESQSLEPKLSTGDDNHDEPAKQLSMTDLEDKALTKRQERVLDYLSQNKFIKNKMYRSLFSVSHKTAHLELVDLVQRQLIVSQGSGRSTCYVIDETCKSLADLVRH
ncbi:hypothetical protein CL658_03520 [bacterium]|nr:hypothetical protein [bacterium]